MDGSIAEAIRDEESVVAAVVVRNPRNREDFDAPSPIEGVPVVVLPVNRGYGSAANLGRGHASLQSAPYRLVMTHDVRLRAGCLGRLVRCLDSNQRVAIVGPTLTGPGGASWAGSSRSFSGRLTHRPVEPFAGTPMEIEYVDWLDGAVLAFRESEVGKFDERLFLYVEDVDLCLSVRPALTVAVCRSAIAEQRSGMTERPGAHGYLMARNQILVSRARDDFGTRAALLARLFVTPTITLARALAGKPPGRLHHMQQLVGQMWGIFDGLRNVAGPPPPRICQWGDIEFL